MCRSSESGAAENQNQKTRPRVQCGEGVHATDNNDHGCGQAYRNRCNEDVVLDFCHNTRPPRRLV